MAAQAQQAQILQLNNDILNKFVLSPGVSYSFHDKTLVNTETVKVYEFTRTPWKLLNKLDVSIDTGFATPNRYVAGFSISLLKLSDYGNLPSILKYIEIRPQLLYSVSFINVTNLANAQQDWLLGATIMSVRF